MNQQLETAERLASIEFAVWIIVGLLILAFILKILLPPQRGFPAVGKDHDAEL